MLPWKNLENYNEKRALKIRSLRNEKTYRKKRTITKDGKQIPNSKSRMGVKIQKVVKKEIRNDCRKFERTKVQEIIKKYWSTKKLRKKFIRGK